MTDPEDAWPNGLEKLLKEHGAKSLIDLLSKKLPSKETPKPKPPAPRLPYKDDDSNDIPD